jgi:hypothetical protein
MLVRACVRATLTTASTQARSHNSVSFGQRLTAGGQYCVLARAISKGAICLARSVWGKFGGLGACGAISAYSLPLPNLLSKSFDFKNVVEKEGLPRDKPSGLAQEVRVQIRPPRPNLSKSVSYKRQIFALLHFGASWEHLGTFTPKNSIETSAVPRKSEPLAVTA